jgi:cellulose synthase/poly-beta-1,6-N-acetylglucosamine synthase-like glycosyltransferase/peptidoglycan/xylan/chitin deacetylase (PgdA/CDA1 family)
LAVCLFVLLGVIVFQGFATHTVGATGEGTASQAAPLARAGAMLSARGSRLVSIEQPPRHRIALTFDDGPDARWTLPIARLLHREGVPATFFEIGSQVARYPDIPRQLVRFGDEIGNHTFTHVLLSAVPGWEAQLQLAWTEAVIAGVTGRYTRLVRPPYSSQPDAMTPLDERTDARLAAGRYDVVLSDYDSDDWSRPGVRTILRNAMPSAFRGGIILFHDGGGNRSQTLSAVRKLIPLARKRGFRFVTVSQLAGLSRRSVMPSVTGLARTRGQIFVICVRAAYLLTEVSAAVLLTIALLVVVRTLLLFVFATYERVSGRRRHSRAPPAAAGEYLPSAVIIVPAFNEEVGIEKSVRSLAASDYPDAEVVVVDDGSTDRTADIVARLGLANVRLIRQDNAGKAAALQRGVEATDSEVVVMVDGDTQFERLTLRNLVQPLRDPAVAAVSGNTKVGNRGGVIGRWQHLEYVIGFNLDRRMYHVLRCMPTIPGAIGAFRRDILEEVGGVPRDTVAEDTDLTLAIGRTGREVVYEDSARAWTEAPATLNGLWRQRYRWGLGTMQSVWKHRGAFFSLRRKQRRIGWITLPYLVLFYILLPLLAPMIDLFALYGFLFIGAEQTMIVWGGFNLLATITAAYALRLDGESLRTVWATPIQQFVYRQLMYLVIIESSVRALQGIGMGWRRIPRTGDAVVGGSP